MEGRTEDKNEGRKEGRNEGRKEGERQRGENRDYHPPNDLDRQKKQGY